MKLNQITQAIHSIWPFKQQEPKIPTPEEIKQMMWHYSQGPRPGFEYKDKKNGST